MGFMAHFQERYISEEVTFLQLSQWNVALVRLPNDGCAAVCDGKYTGFVFTLFDDRFFIL